MLSKHKTCRRYWEDSEGRKVILVLETTILRYNLELLESRNFRIFIFFIQSIDKLPKTLTN